MNLEKMKSRMPPLLPCLIGLIAGLACGWFWPWPIAPYGVSLTIGLVLFGGVVVLAVSLHRAFRRHGTPADPNKESQAIIETGPFRFSRNPVYVMGGILQVALGFVFNNGWVILLTIPALIVIHQVVVRREEAYLEAKFGDQYLKYKSRVRRWI